MNTLNKKHLTLVLYYLMLLMAITSGVVSANAVDKPTDKSSLRDVLIVGNNWDGMVDIIDANSFELVKRLNVVPDKEARLKEIYSFGLRWLKSTFINKVIGEGHDQLVDDMFLSKDGRFIYASRPSFSDVISIDVN
ncbi:MAG: hypothetical protein QMC51_03790, partial [Alteromonadaceae bacterium]